jgi:phage terminase large subunit
VFPTFSSGRRIIWDAIDIAGNRVIDYYLPEDVIESRNDQMMRLRLKGGSQIQIIGSDDVDRSLVGTNAAGMVFSEYAIQKKEAFQYSIPILQASGGFALFVSTPRGKVNHLYDLYQTSLDYPDEWFSEILSVTDTKHISIKDIEQEIEEGNISRELANQEYFCSFQLSIDSSYYNTYLEAMTVEGRYSRVDWDPSLPVFTSWDIGWNDPTVILFAQFIGNKIMIIDAYSNNKKDYGHYAKIVLEKPYTYGKHFGPLDVAVHEHSSGISRWRMMNELGISFVRYGREEKVPGLLDGIEQVRRILPRTWIDSTRCKDLMKALENYQEEKSEKEETIFKGKPEKSRYCHYADAMRYLACSVPKAVSKDSTPEQLNERYLKAVGGEMGQYNNWF